MRDLVTMTGHDLRSPLTVVAAHLQLLREKHGTDQDLDAMERAVRRMNGMVESLLAQARIERSDLDLAAFPLAELTDEVIADHGSVGMSTPGPLPVVYADQELLRHVLDNLVGNALKYARPGVPPKVEITAVAAPGSGVRVEVADWGIGIPEADRLRVFDEFHRSANSLGYRGTGLGLAICRRIVERHSGQIGVNENEGGGSRFWFTLPSET